MATPNVNVPQGTLSRLRGSLTLPSNPQLNVTAPFLGKEGIRLAFEGNATFYVDTMTGAVTSPEPYLKCTLTVHLLKTQPLSDAYKKQMETLSTIGDGTVRGDSAVLSPWSLANLSIQSVRELDFSGTDAGYVVTIGGYYVVNQSLFG